MRTVFLLIIICSLPVLAAATLYSCRDSEGRLHVTDNLQSLPDECRGVARDVETTDPDNLHYVPERTPAPAVDHRSEFQRQLLEQERQQQEQQQREEQLVKEAQGLAEMFEQAQQDRRNALRRWSYDSRATIERAADEMNAARSGKQQLLTDLERQRVSIGTAEQVRALLEQITEP
jgi:hypothetical protein